MPVDHDLGTRAAWRHTPLRRFLYAELLIQLGTFLQVAALLKQVYDVRQREMDIAWVGLAEFLPAFLLVLVTGWVADHLDRKRVALIATAGQLVCSLVLVLLSRGTPTSVVPFFGVALVYGALKAFGSPVIRSFPPNVAPPGGVPKAVTLSSIAWTSASIIGPAVSGLLYAQAPWLAFLAAAIVVGIGGICLFTVDVERGPAAVTDAGERPTLHAAFEGLRFIRRTPMLLAAISLDLFAVLFGGAVALLPAVAEKRLHVGNAAYGFLRAAPGIGAASMGLILASIPLKRRLGPWLLGAVGTFGVFTVVLGLTRTYWIAFVALAVLSAADMVSVVIRSTLVPLLTPDDKRGRVLSVESVFIGASNELGAFESGLAGQVLGVPTAIIGGGVATVAVVGLWTRFFPGLRTLDRYEDIDIGAPTLDDTAEALPSV